MRLLLDTHIFLWAVLVEAIEKSGFLELPVRALHAVGVAELPLYHTDPFDRLVMLV